MTPIEQIHGGYTYEWIENAEGTKRYHDALIGIRSYGYYASQTFRIHYTGVQHKGKRWGKTRKESGEVYLTFYEGRGINCKPKQQ